MTLQYLVSIPLRMFRLWAFIGLLSQVMSKLLDIIVFHLSQLQCYHD